jgi:hypothetical protein
MGLAERVVSYAELHVKATGQQWTTLERLRLTNRNSFKAKEPGLIGLGLVARVLDSGGLAFEDDRPDTLAKALASLERGLARWS